jgi:hypothetical protein
MSTLRHAVKGLIIAGSLLAASATPAGDVTSDRHQRSLQNQTTLADGKGQATPPESEGLKSAMAHLCACATSAKDQHGASGHQH